MCGNTAARCSIQSTYIAYNQLKLNADKTVHINFTRYLNDSFQVLLNNTVIKEVDCTKFLGIWVDSKLTWENHIQNLTEKLSRLCFAFRVLAKILPTDLLKSVYFGYVHSIISYGIIAWGSSSKSTQVLKLQKEYSKLSNTCLSKQRVEKSLVNLEFCQFPASTS